MEVPDPRSVYRHNTADNVLLLLLLIIVVIIIVSVYTFTLKAYYHKWSTLHHNTLLLWLLTNPAYSRWW